MGKRILLFVVTNLAIVLVVSTILSLLGIGRYIGPDGQLQYFSLAVFCLVWGMAGAFISLAMSRWIAKRALGVQLVNGNTGQSELDWLHATVAHQAQAAGLPMPEVGYYEAAEINAFATGPSQKRSLVAVSTGLLRAMPRPEIEAVLGHELGHIKNGDMVTMTLIQGVVNAFVMFLSRIAAFAVARVVDSKIAGLVHFVVLIVLQIGLGILGSLVTAWFSRHREFHADAAGARLAGRENMISALRRLGATESLVDTEHEALATFKISGRTKRMLAAFSTHPPIPVRIAALEGRSIH